MSDAAPIAILVEDEPQIRRFVRTALETEGWHVCEAETLKDGLVEAGTRKPDVVILDLGLPDGDGIDFIRDLRAWSAIPVIVLSARVRAVLRRKVAAGSEKLSVFRFGDVEVDLIKRVVRKRGAEVHLTAIEYRLLSTMISNVEKVITNRQILREVWGPSYVAQEHYVRVHMSHLRRKLEDDSAQPKHLLTETAVGYRLVP